MSRVMATQAMLLAVGVGTKQTVPLAAITAWVLKDGIGHIVAIAFGTFINQRFDSDPKRFRFQAALLGKLADSVSILTLHWPQYFLPLSALGGAFSRLSANCGASCRPKIYETFTRSSNLGDIMRCMTAQTTAAQLLGTATGAALGPCLGSNLYGIMSCSMILSVATVLACYRATYVVRLSTLCLGASIRIDNVQNWSFSQQLHRSASSMPEALYQQVKSSMCQPLKRCKSRRYL
eukprot:Skav200903  [mRNA]  locus=scaffold1581:287214:289963:+ [translate_table: standard]